MKKQLLVVFTILSVVGSILAGAHLMRWEVRSQGESVRLEWQTADEINLKNFIIERKTQQSPYIELVTINPKGSNSTYSYIDESIYKSSDYVFTYRLRITDNDGNVSYSSEISVYPNISGVKKTWGSIKAMFR